ncbi:MAG: tetratricopeptide repeat protein [Desulfobulbaceae bacterium]|nr:tetratricopeptide repeat protein [Desulfobulbaceae bacterium]
MIKLHTWILAGFLSLVWIGSANAHGDISKLPSSVQVLQYQMSLWINSDDLDKRSGLAMAYYRTGELDKAITELQIVLKADPAHFNALDGMGVVLIKKNQANEALEYLKKAYAINSDDIMIYVHLSIAHDKLSQLTEAQKYLEKARTLNKEAGGDEEDIETELMIVSGK